ncbi:MULTISPECIES: CHAT domain-containing protein [unclassified Bradyrhizobium]|uniref:CHAT domain-containing tetratricopeptide repeat protein n=1 Tax=unclassified Bradyrhizobium TaxID=2631580 RepID=UPI00247B0105|nr:MULTISPECIES: CHAT domain-containing protein [unclassified Bradyrhizobium]WGR73360.1 CHAT domain-containing protein [Bradyrhizobium sp. ISRA426]WGR78197.1 CHAT domain-containing protein [Bradyrhizobium sp. ISRA430]WGR88598.1 CHAT domain-containing protein [Bradyrhizobium sp. ISRA432]
MPVAEYEDFELEIGSYLPAGGGPQQYYGRVVKSPGGEAPKSQVKFWFSAPGELAKLRGELESAVLEIDEKNLQGPKTRGEQVLRDFGRGVFRSVFTEVPLIQQVYDRSKGASQDLRIKLRIEAAELAGLPWEYLFDESDVQGFVSLTRPVVRHLDTAGGVGRMGVKGPLRILGMIADPSTSEWPKLDVVRERDRINKGIDALQHDGRVDFQWVPGGTGKDLMKKLLEGEWHIFHFIGHGGVDEASPGLETDGFDERGFVVMVDEDGKPVKKFASDLATMLTEARRSLRLIVLNCCESARINVGDRFGNPAIGLMKTGWLPAVVAMQFPITDNAAISMSEGFYAALAGNRPIDDAVTLARKFIQQKSRVEWGIPVLYMRSSDGRIFDVQTPPRPAGPADGGRPSKEALLWRRDQFMEALAVAPATIEALEDLTRRGQELHSLLAGDNELSVQLAKVYYDLGTLQHKQKQIPRAAASFAYMLKLDPAKPEYFVRRANFNVTVGLYENALNDITEAIKLKPADAEFYWIKGIVSMTAAGTDDKRGYLEQAIKAFGKAVELNQNEPKYFVSRANAYTQIKDVTKARDDMDSAIALAPDNIDLVIQKAKIVAQAA